MGTDSIEFKSYNNVIDAIKCIGENHYQIKAVTTGDIWEVDLEKNTKFPLFHISPVDIDAEVNQLKYNFQLIVCDLVEPSKENEQDVISDTAQIMVDIISIFKQGEILAFNSDSYNPKYFTDFPFKMSLFTERFDNDLYGWIMDFSVITEQNYDACNVPSVVTDSECLK